jgi:hypothetical protein
MPEIIVSATDRAAGAGMLRERITATDFESAHFAAQLIERLGWAVSDAHAAEQAHAEPDAPPRETEHADSAALVR